MTQRRLSVSGQTSQGWTFRGDELCTHLFTPTCAALCSFAGGDGGAARVEELTGRATDWCAVENVIRVQTWALWGAVYVALVITIIITLTDFS